MDNSVYSTEIYPSLPGTAYSNTLQVSLQMIADELDDALISYSIGGTSPDTAHFSGIQIYDGQALHKSQLYLIEGADSQHFPINEYAYITRNPISGNAPHISHVEKSSWQLINLLLRIFEKYHKFENDLNNAIAQGHDLEDLCRIGARFFRNPMYIHDTYYNVIALPSWIEGMLNFTYDENSKQYHIPLSLIEDFKFNDQYKETLSNRHAGIWGADQYPFGMRSMYVNLWDGEVSRGRLLINELNTVFKPGQFQVAEFLGRKIVECIHQESQHALYHAHSYEKTLRSLVIDNHAHPGDIQQMLSTLDWKDKDFYLCTCLQSQNQDLIITSENVFRSALASIFPRSILFFIDRKLFMITNLTKSDLKSSEVHHMLAPLARDSLMYGGMSNPIQGIYRLPYAYQQSVIAFQYASRWQNAQWVLEFEKCALSYLYENINSDLPAEYRVSSALLTLRQHDQEKGSEFYHTLKIFLECERNIPKASAALVIHRTTLIYRLDKINELVRLSLDNPEDRLYLLISFRILDQEVPLPS